jgi:hypothetical protein
MPDPIDEVLEKLAKNVEAAVHALYRGDTRQATAKVRTGQLVREAAELLRSQGRGLPPGSAAPAPSAVGRASAPMVAGTAVGWSREEGEAVMKCVTGWLPMGSPASAPPDSKCIASGREMVPTWSEREVARAALKKITAV